MINAITFASQPCLAESTVEEMISDYHRMHQELQRAHEIADHQKNYSKLEVEQAIRDQSFLDARLQILKFEIEARGGKIQKKEKPAAEDPPDPGEEKKAGAGEKSKADDRRLYMQNRAIKIEEHRIHEYREKLRDDPDSKNVKLWNDSIKRSEDRIRKIRDSARKTISVSPGSVIKAEQGANSVEAKLPEVRRPWTLRDYPWDFHHPLREFKTLKDKYYRLQEEMGKVLLIKREHWTLDQAIIYNGRLSTLCKLIIDTEEDLAFGLGNATNFERAIKQHQWKWEIYLDKQRVTDAAEKEMNDTWAEFYKLFKKSGLTLGDQIPMDDPNGRKLGFLQGKYNKEQNIFLAKRIVSETAKYESGAVSDSRLQRIEDGLALTREKTPELHIHRKCNSGESISVFEMFLTEDGELAIYKKQTALRPKRTIPKD